MKASNNETENVQQTGCLAGQVNNQALVDEIVSQAVSQPTADEQGRMERRSMLASMRVASTTEVEPEVSALTVDDVGLFALSDIHGLKGKQKRQQAVADKQKERLDYALMVIRDHGGCISRKQLTEILVKKFENRRQTISGFISQWIKDKLLFEMNAVISDSDKMYFGL